VPIYCDIVTKILIGLSFALPCTSLCLNRRLCRLATARNVMLLDGREKRRNTIIDILIGIVAPLIFMAVHYTMQGHRYDVIEDLGCSPTTYGTAPAYVLVYAPPVAVSLISVFFCTRSFTAFLRYRNDFNQLLKATSPRLSSHGYIRLMALSCTELFIGLPLTLYFLVFNLVHNGVATWISWDDTHYDFNRVQPFPFEFWLSGDNYSGWLSLQVNRWSFPLLAFVFFAFFGFCREARSYYRIVFFAIAKPFGVVPRHSRHTTLASTAGTVSTFLPIEKKLSPAHYTQSSAVDFLSMSSTRSTVDIRASSIYSHETLPGDRTPCGCPSVRIVDDYFELPDYPSPSLPPLRRSHSMPSLKVHVSVETVEQIV